MGQPVRIVTTIKDFPGLATAIDPHDLPAGLAEEQVNAQSATPGLLEVRPGYRVVSFEENS